MAVRILRESEKTVCHLYQTHFRGYGQRSSRAERHYRISPKNTGISSVLSSKAEEPKVKPLFANYLFARMAYPDDYYVVIWTKGVRRIVGNGSEPISLDDSVVDFFKTQTKENGFIRPSSQLMIGDRVRVKNGPLEGLIGTIAGSIDEKGRIKVLMNFLKEGIRVEIPYSFLEIE